MTGPRSAVPAGRAGGLIHPRARRRRLAVHHTHIYPADGTLVSGAGAVFRFAGGAPIYVHDWAAIGGPQPAVQVDSYTLEHGDGAWPFNHTHIYPADGTFVITAAGTVSRVRRRRRPKRE